MHTDWARDCIDGSLAHNLVKNSSQICVKDKLLFANSHVARQAS